MFKKFLVVLLLCTVLSQNSLVKASDFKSDSTSLVDYPEFSELDTDEKIEQLENATTYILNEYVKSGNFGYNSYNYIGDFKYRQDCSGFVDACLAYSGVLDPNVGYSSSDYIVDKKLRSTLKIKGFSYKKFNVSKLGSASVLVKRGGLCICFKSGKKYKIANCGSKDVKGFKVYSKKQLKDKKYTNMYVLES